MKKFKPLLIYLTILAFALPHIAQSELNHVRLAFSENSLPSDLSIENYHETANSDLNYESNSILLFFCEGLNANVSESCDDGNPQTINDVVTGDCDCQGVNVDGCFASEIVEYNMGGTASGDPIEPARLITEKALGPPELDNGYNFLSLGYSGSVILAFNEVALNGPGPDIRVWETTFNSENCESYEEVAEVSVSQDGIDYFSLGTTCTNEAGEFDISDAMPAWTYVRYVRITDLTPEGSLSEDGYDVDGVEAINGCDMLGNVVILNPDDRCFASEIVEYTMGGTASGDPIEPIRLIVEKALGAPELDNSYNFLSLGYGGSLVVGFSEVALNGPGPDIRVWETTFNSETCDSYEEVAEISVSQDGITYFSLGTTCTNEAGEFDISDAMPAWTYVMFVRIEDLSPEGSLSEDAYDVDGVEAINGCDELGNLVILDPDERCFASQTLEYTMGGTASGNPIEPIRLNTDNALGAPELDNSYNFLSLGYGGSVVLGFSEVALNGPGPDIRIWETTFNSETCDSYEEVAEISVSQNGVTYVSLGTTCTNEAGEFDISDVMPAWTYVMFVRVDDLTPEGSLSEDGYDVDAVEAINGCDILANIIPSFGECAATEFLSYTMGESSTGGPIEVQRTDPTKALGFPENDNTYNFVSLGYGGELIVGFNQLVMNGPGPDIRVFETTFNNEICDSYTETAEVFVSQDGLDYISLGTTCTNQDDAFDISDSDPSLEYILFVKIIDISPEGSASYDGFDVDAVTALHPCVEIPTPFMAGGNCNATDVVTFLQGPTINGKRIMTSRPNPLQALGAPQDNDSPNFVSLGYGGHLTLSFNGPVLNGEGDDIQIVETSYGSPSCENHIEYADISVSQDGNTFYPIGTICQDGSVDIGDAAIPLNYIFFVRIENSDLSTTLDGYDVDAVIAIHSCSEEEMASHNGNTSNGPQAEDILSTGTDGNISLKAYPNPSKGETVVNFSVPSTSYTTLEVYNMEGKMVASLFSQEAAADNQYRLDFNGIDLPNGMYVYRLTSNERSVIEKFTIAR